MMRFSLVAAVLFLALQPASHAQSVTAAALPLEAGPEEQAALGRLAYRGGLVLASDDERFGGLSALEVSGDGTRLLALSDSAWWVTGALAWDDAMNTLSGFSELSISPVRDSDGRHFEGRSGDSEGLAALGDGRYAVSFERQHRVLTYALGEDWSSVGTALPETMDIPEALSGLPDNRGLESLARTDDGRLVMGVEYPTDLGLGHALWAGDDTGWQRYSLHSRPSFGLTGMAAHDGTIYALERFYSRAAGNRIGIIAFPVPETGAPAAITPETLGRIDPPLPVDNFEGIAVIERGGETLVLIISDDNFSDRQRTLLMAFAVGE